jgi:ABC-2 type transport system permease protein
MSASVKALAEEAGGSRAASRRLTSTWREARLFWCLRAVVLRAMSEGALRNSRVQVISVVLASAILWIGLFLLFCQGFLFIQSGIVHEGLRAQMIQVIFNVFFLALSVMLVFSSAIILYGGLYRSEEVAFLLSTPTRCSRIVLHKFHETVFFSCWGFVLLGSPMLISYGIVASAPWYYYVLLIPFVISFVLIPAGIGAIFCLLVVRLLPKLRTHMLATMGAVAVIVIVALGWRVLAYENRDMMDMTWFQDVLARLEFSEQRMLPSWWLSSGLLEAAHPVANTNEDGWQIWGERQSWRDSLMFLALLASNALFLMVIIESLATWTFRASYSAMRGIVPARRRAGLGWLDRATLFICSPFPRVIRHFIVKDLRLFRRDPVQWSQFAIFFGLLMLYFFNVRRFDYAGVMQKWVTIISFLNLAVVGLILSTFTTRFIFPMISIEGRRFWILGTAPINRDAILWGKFCFACAGSLPPCAVLVLVSDIMLRIASRSMAVVVIHQIGCAVLCVGLAALAVGLGAKMPNLRETSPSKIAAGFGGTLNLVFSSLFIIGVVLSLAVPTVFWVESDSLGIGQSQSRFFGGMVGLGTGGSVLLGLGVTLVLGACATIIPFRIGLLAFRRLEN